MRLTRNKQVIEDTSILSLGQINGKNKFRKCWLSYLALQQTNPKSNSLRLPQHSISLHSRGNSLRCRIKIHPPRPSINNYMHRLTIEQLIDDYRWWYWLDKNLVGYIYAVCTISQNNQMALWHQINRQ